jgi:hypothetical protein
VSGTNSLSPFDQFVNYDKKFSNIGPWSSHNNIDPSSEGFNLILNVDSADNEKNRNNWSTKVSLKLVNLGPMIFDFIYLQISVMSLANFSSLVLCLRVRPGAYPRAQLYASLRWALALSKNITLGWKRLPRTKTLAYYKHS